jgi:DnaJ-class molecular chaperone
MAKMMPCLDCGGKGYLGYRRDRSKITCPACGGKGKVPEPPPEPRNPPRPR